MATFYENIGEPEGGRTNSRTGEADRSMEHVRGYEILISRQKEVLALLMENEETTYRDLRKKIGISIPAFQKNIIALKEKGAIAREGTFRGKWTINYETV